MEKDISKIFNKFAGREIEVIEKPGVPFKTVRPKHKNDPVMEEMEKVAKANGLVLRFTFGIEAVTMDYRHNRVNVSVQEDEDGKYRIPNEFDIG